MERESFTLRVKVTEFVRCLQGTAGGRKKTPFLDQVTLQNMELPISRKKNIYPFIFFWNNRRHVSHEVRPYQKDCCFHTQRLYALYTCSLASAVLGSAVPMCGLYAGAAYLLTLNLFVQIFTWCGLSAGRLIFRKLR